MIKEIGIDMDSHDKWRYNEAVTRMNKVGMIKDRVKTKYGWHFKVSLNEPQSFKDSIIMRLWLFDDPYRILFDIFRVWKGYKHIDILFDRKWRGW